MSTIDTEASRNQCAMILRFMRDFGGISQAQAIDEFGCYRLGARIWDLRHRGYSIKTEKRTKKNRYGKTVNYAVYLLEGDRE